MKTCKSGYYYCNTDKKCKKIPRGYHVGMRGYLYPDKDDDSKSNGKKNGNGNGNVNGNGNGNGGNGGNGGGMSEELNKNDRPFVKKLVGKLRKGSKTHAKQADDLEKAMNEVTMTTAQKRKDTMLKKKYDDSGMKKNMQKQYGKEEGKKVYFATIRKQAMEGSLHKWFSGSKSKDGKGGWVNVVTGGTCASDKPGEGTPKCVSSSKRASMTKAERLSAARRKKKADPGQQSKTGAAKPTYVRTDSPRKKKMKEETLLEKDVKGKGSGTKDACYHKVKSRYSVWPSAYASGALVKCRKVGAANWGNSSKKEEYEFKKFTEFQNEVAAWQRKAGKNKSGGLNEKGRKSYERENPGSDLKAPSKKVGNPRRKSFCSRMKGMKKKLTSAKTASDPNSRINKALRKWNC